MNKILLVVLFFCFSGNLAQAMDRKAKHKLFQSFVEKRNMQGYSAHYRIKNQFKEKFDELTDIEKHYLKTDVNARIDLLSSRLSDETPQSGMNKAKKGFLRVGFGSILFSFGLYNLLDNKNLYNRCWSGYLSQGLTWSTIFFGSKYMYCGMKKVVKSLCYSTIIHDQLEHERALKKALENPDSY